MDRFVSNYTLRLDAKGRVSIPASFRAVLARDGFAGLYCYRTLDRPALIAPGIERRPIERPIAVEAGKTVAGEDGAERRRDRHPSLRIQTQRVIGHEAVHGAPCSAAPVRPASRLQRTGRSRHAHSHGGRPRKQRRHMGYYGLSWDYL